jgi:hypothetical protein
MNQKIKTKKIKIILDNNIQTSYITYNNGDNMTNPPIQNVYILKARNYGDDEDDVYVFHEYRDACEKAFEYFDMLMSSTDPERDLKELEDWLFEMEAGYFTILSTNIQ